MSTEKTEKKEELNPLEALLAQYNKNNAPKNTTSTYNVKNYFSASLKEKETSKTYRIRILPPSEGQSTSFDEMWIHQVKDSKNKTQKYTCLKKHKNEACPFCEANEALYATGKEEDKKLAANYYARQMYVVKVIDRENEADGVKFWRFAHDRRKQGIFDKIYGVINAIKQDITNKDTGRDLVLTVARDQNGYPNVNSIAQLDASPLSDKKENMDAWLADNRTWKDVFGIKSYDYLEIIVKGGEPFYDKQQEKWIDKLAAKENEAVQSDAELSIGLEKLKAESDDANAAGNGDDESELPF